MSGACRGASVSKVAKWDGIVDERAQHFLKTLIERYIRDGQPVGSRVLARDSGLDLSPATVRNVLADLEDLGLIVSPHTSAGRIPTVRGYRLFIDSLLTVKPLDDRQVEQFQGQLSLTGDTSSVLSSASRWLSEMSHMAGVVTMPKPEQVVFRQIEFVRLSAARVLAILVTVDGEVINRVIQARRDYTPSELEQTARLLNETFSGLSLAKVRERLLSDMQQARDDMNQIMRRAVEMAEQVLGVSEEGDCLISGQTNLMGMDELAEMERLRRLFDAFTEKHEIIHLLDDCMSAEGIRIFIGRESGYKSFDGCSLVTAPYKVDDQVMGMLGVIGPTRMAYDRVIPLVDVTARLVGAALRKDV
ncbi:MAG: heat-inducible transcriptional repressor HrcA [Gammaproteobacteria bacterium RIFOXYA12_FULL_61_12]|nr:MAG: heat-inducible transcriptional repressor HrcA [Gammaproteobacteria bacterium RIFOXYD12_FULL_61_37]OGT92959.1 MAG: heat-inducible transcriptional repressor HrcA [Gammaproteobacteria bacterium RIFOXYA12_FULL_61_12]